MSEFKNFIEPVGDAATLKKTRYMFGKIDQQALRALWNYLCVRDDVPARADAIIVGGAARMLDMAQRAAELYHQGVSDTIVVTGFKPPSLDMNESEASLLRRVLIASAVPDDCIIVEENAANTGQNIQFSEHCLRQRLTSVETVVLVHKPFMTRRFLATAEAQWPAPQPNFFVTSVDMTLADYFRMHHQAYPDDPCRMIRSMLGDYARIKSYPAQGFSSAQPVSDEAEQAYRRLLDLGFEERGV